MCAEIGAWLAVVATTRRQVLNGLRNLDAYTHERHERRDWGVLLLGDAQRRDASSLAVYEAGDFAGAHRIATWTRI